MRQQDTVALMGGAQLMPGRHELSTERRMPAWALCHMDGLEKALPSSHSQVWGEFKVFVFPSTNKISIQGFSRACSCKLIFYFIYS